MNLPIFQDPNRNFMLMQTGWASQLNQLLSNPLFNGQLLTNISLKNGATTFNHLLGQMQHGWFLTDLNGVAEIYRSQPFNAKTLTLTSNAAVEANFYVF